LFQAILLIACLYVFGIALGTAFLAGIVWFFEWLFA
jgi:hypothetical protein